LIPTNSLHEFLRTRRSVRRFTSEPLPDDVLERILTSAGYAPSAHNRQPWRFVILTDSAMKSRLAQAMALDFRRDLASDGLPDDEIDRQASRSISRIESAPVIVLMCMDLGSVDLPADPRRAMAERTMAIQSVAAAATQLLLAAHAEGLGGVWICSPLFAPEAVRRTLGLESSLEPQGMVFVGHIQTPPSPRERKPLSEISSRR
jgi:coenzyme F420-0:L-glutamate ligase / coenzyme F420-1:gamma-L-glutamate ligase